MALPKMADYVLLIWHLDTDLSIAKLEIYQINFFSVKPSEAPLLVGFKSRYRVGETLDMQCFINNTYPSANITWFINGIAVTSYF